MKKRVCMVLIIAILLGLSACGEKATTVEETTSAATIEADVATEQTNAEDSEEEYKSSCEEIPYKDLCRYPDQYKGHMVAVKVKVQQIMDAGLLSTDKAWRTQTDNDGYGWFMDDEYYMVDKRSGDSVKILKDDIIVAYGEFIGLESITRALTGSSDELPKIEVKYVDLVDDTVTTTNGTATQTDSNSQSEVFNTTPSINETILVDQDNVKITATSIEYDEYDVILNLLIENNSEKNLQFTSNTIGFSGNSINGVMVPDGYLNADVESGKKSVESIEFGIDDLKFYGIQEVAEIVLGFTVSDDDYNSTEYADCVITTSIGDSYTYSDTAYQEAIQNDAAMAKYGYTVPYFVTDTLYNQNDMQIVSTGLVVNSSGNKAVLLEVVNTGTADQEFAVTGAAINGLSIYESSWSYTYISAGKRAIVTAELDDMLENEWWDTCGITEIGSININVGIAEDWDVLNKGTINLTMNADIVFDDSGVELYNQNNVRIISKGLFEPLSDYDWESHLLLIVENNSGEDLNASVAYDGTSVNDFMIDTWGGGITIPNGKAGIVIVDLDEDDLAEINVDSIDQITKIEAVIEFIDDDYNTVLEAPIALEF